LAVIMVEDVWDTLNVGDSDIPEAKVLKTIEEAEIGLVHHEEFRKNAIKFGRELWDDKAPKTAYLLG
jgi:hypothetical protein